MHTSPGRIQLDRARCSKRLKPLLEYLEGNLFDRGLNVQRWKRACNIRTNTIERQFGEELELAPHAYLTTCRMETAARLLLLSQIKIWRITVLVGYSDLGVFSRGFERWSGMRPSKFRKIEGSAAQLPVSGVVANHVKLCRLALTGAVDSAKVTVLNESLRALYPAFGDRRAADAAPGETQERDDLDERKLAASMWEQLKDRPLAEQRNLVRQQLCFRTPALFDLLRAKSREAGRQDRRRGVELAELALASLEGCAEALGEDLPNRKAEGWIWLANARRLALDHLAAEQGFLIAEAEWSLAEKRDPLVEAEFLFYKATLRWFQRSHGEALRLVTRAIDLSRRLGVPVLLARSLILRAGVRKNVGDIPATIPDLREALELINEHDHLYLSCVAYTHLATSHIRLEDYEEAAKVVSQARELCRELEYEIGWYQVLWLDGLVQQGLGQYLPAERFLEEAHQGFIKLRERGYAAVIALDRGMLCHKQGRHSDVLALASQAIPILESFKIRREVLAALKLLRAALEKQEVTMALLQQVRDCLDDLLRDSATWSVLRQN